jgi:hypothetical protein
MSNWTGNEARAECRDLRVRVRELEAEVTDLHKEANKLTLDFCSRIAALEQRSITQDARWDWVVENKAHIYSSKRVVGDAEEGWETSWSVSCDDGGLHVFGYDSPQEAVDAAMWRPQRG